MVDLATITDKDIFDAIRYRRGAPLPQDTIDYLNAIMYPKGQAGAGPAYDRVKLEAELTVDEGKRLKAYKDTKSLWSIGIGRNLDGCGTTPLTRTKADVIANGITDAECDQLFEYDIDRTESDLDRYASWWRKLDGVRQRVMLNMCFNMGWGAGTTHGLHTFVNTLGMIEHGEYSRAADAMTASLWAKQVGSRAVRLAGMMRNGK